MTQRAGEATLRATAGMEGGSVLHPGAVAKGNLRRAWEPLACAAERMHIRWRCTPGFSLWGSTASVGRCEWTVWT